MACRNQFNHIFRYSNFGAWGLKEFQHEVNPPAWDALMALCDGVPDVTDSSTDVFPGFLAAPPTPIGPSDLASTIVTRGLPGLMLSTRGYAPAAVPPPVVIPPLPRTDPDAGTAIVAVGVDPDAGTLLI